MEHKFVNGSIYIFIGLMLLLLRVFEFFLKFFCNYVLWFLQFFEFFS